MIGCGRETGRPDAAPELSSFLRSTIRTAVVSIALSVPHHRQAAREQQQEHPRKSDDRFASQMPEAALHPAILSTLLCKRLPVPIPLLRLGLPPSAEERPRFLSITTLSSVTGREGMTVRQQDAHHDFEALHIGPALPLTSRSSNG